MDQISQHLGHVTETGADHAEQDAEPDARHQIEQQAKGGQRRGGRKVGPENKNHQHKDKNVVQENDELPEHHAQDTSGGGKIDLGQKILAADEDGSPFVDEAGNQSPGDHPGADIGKKVPKGHPPQRAENNPHPQDGGADTDGDPQRPDNGTAVFQFRVHPRPVQGKTPGLEADTDILQGRVHYLVITALDVEEEIIIAGYFSHRPRPGENENGIAPL